MLQLQKLRLLPHSMGWSDEAWMLAERAAAIRKDERLRDEAAATLIGLELREWSRRSPA